MDVGSFGAVMSCLGGNGGHTPPYLVCKFVINTLIIISISTNIHRPDVCDPLSSYISLVNKSIGLITPHWSSFINYPHRTYNLIKDQFNPINRLSYQPVGCQATPCTTRDMEYVRTLLYKLFLINYRVCIIFHLH